MAEREEFGLFPPFPEDIQVVVFHETSNEKEMPIPEGRDTCGNSEAAPAR